MNINIFLIQSGIEIATSVNDAISVDISTPIDYIPEDGNQFILISNDQNLLADDSTPILI